MRFGLLQRSLDFIETSGIACPLHLSGDVESSATAVLRVLLLGPLSVYESSVSAVLCLESAWLWMEMSGSVYGPVAVCVETPSAKHLIFTSLTILHYFST